MKAFTVLAVVLAVGAARADDAPKPPAPVKEHEWLKQLAGEWDTTAACSAAPGQPAVTWKGTESTRLLGGFWAMGEHKGDVMGTPMTGVMTVGYDTAKKKFVGTWVCSMCDFMFRYEGELDETGKVLTLHTEGPDPATGKTTRMKDVLTIKDKDSRELTSSAQGADGKWTPFMTMTAKRKK